MKEIPIYHMGILMPLQIVRGTTSIMKFLTQSKTYGKIIISQETQEEFQYSPPGLTPLLSLVSKGLVTMILDSL